MDNTGARELGTNRLEEPLPGRGSWHPGPISPPGGSLPNLVSKAKLNPSGFRSPSSLTEVMTEQEKAFAEGFVERLNSPLRVVIEIVPEKWIMLDSDKMARDTAGELTEDERGPLLEADAKRMPKELEKRGLS